MTNNMPKTIYARPVGATRDVGDAKSGPWSLENPFGTSKRYDEYVTPSTDFTEVLSNPNQRFLVYCSNNGMWFIAYCRYGDDFITLETKYLMGDQAPNITHWLPLPNNP